MPAKDKHIAQAHHNHQFWNDHDLDTTPYCDWVVTGIFYEAVHWLEAFLAGKGTHPGTHGQRNYEMQRYQELDPILVDYDVLKTESENARYGCYAHSADDIRNDLIPIVTNVQTHIATLL